MARSACCSSRVNGVSGTSSDTGRTATVDRLDAWTPASHWLPEVCRARLRPEETQLESSVQGGGAQAGRGSPVRGPLTCCRIFCPSRWISLVTT